MIAPRYQVFVSSTFRDLQEERQAALDAILELNHFPAGMEIFPAANATPWELIRRVIDESDYYILIVGGKYGSTDEHGISYTEREYDLAVELKKPVLPFLHASPDSIPAGKFELEPKTREKLDKFREKVQRHHCKYWANKDDLKAQVIVSLTWAIRTSPSIGWVRADGINNQELLSRLSELQSRYQKLLDEADALSRQVAQSREDLKFAQGEDQVLITFKIQDEKIEDQVILTWNQVFVGVARQLLTGCSEEYLDSMLEEVVFGAFYGTQRFNEIAVANPAKKLSSGRLIMSNTSKEMLHLQFLALNLAQVESVTRTVHAGERAYDSTNIVWKLTEHGRKLFLSKVAVPSSGAVGASSAEH